MSSPGQDVRAPETPEASNPYAAPAAGPTACREAPTALLARAGGYALLVNIGASVVVGAVSALQFGFGLRRFGGITYVPRVIVLSALRAHAPGAACLLTCLTAVVVVHRASRLDASVPAVPRRAFLLGLLIFALYPVDAACILAGGGALSSWVYSLPFGDFVAEARATALREDVACGAARTAAMACGAALLLPPGLRIVAASARGLAVKLVVAWLAIQAGSFAIGAAVNAVLGWSSLGE